MKPAQSAQPADPGKSYPLDTEEFGKRNHVKGQSVRARVCRTGSYFGVRPLILANGRLAWPDMQVTAAAPEKLAA